MRSEPGEKKGASTKPAAGTGADPAWAAILRTGPIRRP
jgi:hypothetical protein